MEFHSNQIYHIYNQGNNRRQIFFSDANYNYFLWKMRGHLLPFGDLIAYCLMPNHFHWLFLVREVEVKRAVLWLHLDKIEARKRQIPLELVVKTNTQKRVANKNSWVGLNESIGYLQGNYTKGINKERRWSGSLFRKRFKAKDGFIDELIALRKPNGQPDPRFQKSNDYAYQCFKYIHENPKAAGLVDEALNWKYSSAMDYAGLRKGSLCNLDLGRNLMLYR